MVAILKLSGTFFCKVEPETPKDYCVQLMSSPKPKPDSSLTRAGLSWHKSPIPATLGFSMTEPPPDCILLSFLDHPQMLDDADTLASRKISDGTAVHLFQRPKTAMIPVGGTAGGVVSTAQQPGRLHEFPPVLVRVRGAGAGGSSGAAGYVNAHWEVDGARKQIRLLASFLLLISIIQVSFFFG